MYSIKIDINPAIYEHIMFFLKNLPKNMIRISFDEKEHTTPTQKQLKQFQVLSQNISHVDKDIDILALDKDINSDLFYRSKTL
ncbi:MAG: hypothetical protein U9N49_13160 [Campylobacterota bacterium]|nr:hypothetical protein [Campylobacterota bacterium]